MTYIKGVSTFTSPAADSAPHLFSGGKLSDLPFGQGVPSTDKKGHGQTIRAQIPPGMRRGVDKLAADPMWPCYQTPQDVVRDGLYRLLLEADHQNALDTEMHEIADWMIVENAQLHREKRQEFVSGVVEKFTRQLSLCGGNEVGDILKEVRLVLGMANLPGNVRVDLEGILEKWDG